MSSNPVDDLLERIESGSWDGFDGLADDAVLDATVPGWRLVHRDGASVLAQFRHWFADPSVFLDLRRTPLPTGELVELFFQWDEPSGRHWASQAHVLEVDGGRIVRDRMFCGGRWDERTAAEMRLAELVG